MIGTVTTAVPKRSRTAPSNKPLGRITMRAFGMPDGEYEPSALRTSVPEPVLPLRLNWLSVMV